MKSGVTFGGRYRLLHRIAQGGMADVYLALDVDLDRQVALKVLSSELADDPSFVERFRREAKAAANLNHPNIVGIYDWGQENDTYYIVMEYVDGRSIAKVLRSTGSIKPDRAAEIAVGVASALACAHDAGLIHRDVTLGNVMVSDEGEVKVTDFGIATALAHRSEDELTQIGSVVGTTVYFSPEQAQGRPLDGRSDLYSLGVGLYEMIVGAPPFAAETPTALAVKHVQERPMPIRQMGVDIAESLEAIVLKLLAKDAAHRYPKATDLQADLERYLAGDHSLTQEPDVDADSASSDGSAATGAATEVDTAVTTGHSSAEAQAQQPPTVADDRGGAAGQSQPLGSPALGAAGHVAPNGLQPTEAWPSQPNQYPPPTYYYEEVQDSGTWKRTALTLVALVALLGLFGWMGKYFYDQLGFGDSGSDVNLVEDLVEVPDFKGLGILEAEARANNFGLGTDMSYRINTTATENTVFAQAPPAGRRVERGSIVKLTVSRDETPRVPNVVGRNSVVAKNTLEGKGYLVIKHEETNQAEVGIVFRQDPPSRTELQPGEAVKIIVSTGPGRFYVPDVRNMTTREAMGKLAGLGFRVGERTESHNSVEEGLVIDTDPTVGTPVEPQSEVFVVTSSGLPMVQIPDVTGVLFDTGRLTIEREGLKLGSVDWEHVPEGSPSEGRILDQNPKRSVEVEGETVVVEVQRGTAINVTVGLGVPSSMQEPQEPDSDSPDDTTDSDSDT